MLNETAIAPRFGVTGCELNGPVEIGQGVGRIAPCMAHHAAIIPGLGPIRLRSDCAAELGDRTVKISLFMMVQTSPTVFVHIAADAHVASCPRRLSKPILQSNY